MRIFQVIKAATNSSVPGNQTWYRNLYEPLIDMGCEVFLFPANDGWEAMYRKDKQLKAKFSQRLIDTFIKEHEKAPFDVFFSYIMDGIVEPAIMDEIKKKGAITCNFSCNNMHQFHLVAEIAPYFDYNLHSEKEARGKFLDIGATPLWWPMASNPKYFKPDRSSMRDIDVSFVGANYALRGKYLHHLLENKIDVHAFGPGWKCGASSSLKSWAKHYLYLSKLLFSFSRGKQAFWAGLLAEHDFIRKLSYTYQDNFHEAVTDTELIAMYSRSHISLGFLEVQDKHDPSNVITRHLHLRDFEAPMCGALYCTGYLEELTEMFDPDKEVIVYANQYELLDKVRYYLGNPDEAEKIRWAGYRRALEEHTYHKRFRKLFLEIGMVK